MNYARHDTNDLGALAVAHVEDAQARGADFYGRRDSWARATAMASAASPRFQSEAMCPFDFAAAFAGEGRDAVICESLSGECRTAKPSGGVGLGVPRSVLANDVARPDPRTNFNPARERRYAT